MRNVNTTHDQPCGTTIYCSEQEPPAGLLLSKYCHLLTRDGPATTVEIIQVKRSSEDTQWHDHSRQGKEHTKDSSYSRDKTIYLCACVYYEVNKALEYGSLMNPVRVKSCTS